MDFNEFFNDEDRDIIQKVLNGTAVCSMFNWYSEQTEYLFKFQNIFYIYTSHGKFKEKLYQCKYQNEVELIREILEFHLSGESKEIKLDECLKKGQITVFMDRSVFYSPENEYYVWYDTDEEHKCHKIVIEDVIKQIVGDYDSNLLRYNFEDISNKELEQVRNI